MAKMFTKPLQHPSMGGTAHIEFAIILPILVAMIFGTIELGRAIYSFNTLDKMVRDAARHMSQNGAGDSLAASEARCLAVTGDVGCVGDAVLPGLTVSNVVTCDAILCPTTHADQLTGTGFAVNLVTVEIKDYSYNFLTNFIASVIKFNGISVTMRGPS